MLKSGATAASLIAVFVLLVSAAPAAADCGDAIPDVGEDCDDGNTLDGDCCSSTCQFEPATSPCANDGSDCTLDECDGAGLCTHPAGNAGTVCRPSADACDVAETCDGASTACPADGFATAGVPCPDDGLVCTTDACDGAGTCAHPAGHAGTVCRAAAGVCDTAETCTGTSTLCPADGFVGAGTVCRAASGSCDVAEACTGSSAACPTDGFAPSTTVCRAAAGVCDAAEHCTGTGAACPADGFVDAGTVCRAGNGACDAAETCTGASATCPSDVLAAAGTVCRPASGVCDAAETCDGVSANCGPNLLKPAGTSCRPAAGICDVPESCTGASFACPNDVFLTAGTLCRVSADECDQEEYCTGSQASCPTDIGAPLGTPCTDDGEICTKDMCSGTHLCIHPIGNQGTVCRAPSAFCDLPETCDGLHLECPDDVGPVDSDFDGTADGCDLCTGPVSWSSAQLKLSRYDTPLADDKLVLSGDITMQYPFMPLLDPATHGVRIILRDGASTIVDTTIPPGPYDPLLHEGWKSSITGTKWQFKSLTGVAGIRKVLVKRVAQSFDRILLKITGLQGTFVPSDTALSALVIFDPPMSLTGLCAEVDFSGPSPVCVTNASGSAMKCK